MTYIEQNIIGSYSGLFEGLSVINKIELIEVLTKSLKSQVVDKEKNFFQFYGALTSDKSAEEIIADVKESRSFIEKDLDF